MTKHGPVIRVEVPGTEYSSEYATRNAEAFIELGKAVADTFNTDYSELRITDEEHYLVVEQEDELRPYSLREFEPCVEYGEDSFEEAAWKKALSLEGFEEMLESIKDSGAEIQKFSRAGNYSPRSEENSSESLRKVPSSYRDASLPLTSENKDINTLFTAAPNSGTGLNPSPVDLAEARAKSVVKDKTVEELLAEKNRSGQPSYAELELQKSWQYENGFTELTENDLEEIVENVSGFEAEYLEPEGAVNLD